MKVLTRIVIFIFALVVNSAFATESLQKFDGTSTALSEFTGKGKWTIVMIWAHDCHVCNQEAYQYQAFHVRHQDKDAQMLGISMDGKKHLKDAREFIKRHKLTFPNIIGEPEEVAGVFEDLTGMDWYGTPTFLIYNSKGELRAQQVGAVPVNLIEDFMQKESAVVK